MNYGFSPENVTLESDHYVLGGFNSLPKVVLQPSGQWDAFLPVYEPQLENGYDTFGCTVWGTENAIEILEKRLTGKESNYSEKYIYNTVPVRPPGADPHKVIEAIREVGLIPDEPTPATFEEFCTPTPPTDAQLKEGGKWTDKWTVGHEWVFSNVSESTRTTLMKEALTYSPICVSVSAWYEKDGVYVDKGQPNNHWVVVYGWTDKGWKVFDSYDHSQKIVSYNHNILYAKRYSLTPVLSKEHWLIALVKQVLGLTKPVTKVNLPTPPSTPAPKTPCVRLYEAAVASLGTDASPKDVAPDELACAESVNNIFFKAFGEYIETPGISTTRLFAAMVDRADKFERTTVAEPGVIIISPTGFASQVTPINNGHVGIFGKGDIIMSNSSISGKFEQNYTLASWIKRYRDQGKFPIYFIKPI